ncbi:MAG: LD-carboxypeptidase [Cyanobacteriota bacterium]|nr:LD-carboxypeptidase [Cyanobacteriota bacterium]
MPNPPTPIQLPPPLKPGDLVQVITPSGCLRETTPSGRNEVEAYLQGVEIWKSRGYRVQIDPGCNRTWGYLAGTDTQRREQLERAWTDPQVRGILCARGGYGATRLLENWSWPEIETPKWTIGFSDITALLWSLGDRGIASVHGPVLTSLAAEPEWSVERLFDLVEGRPLQDLQGQGWGGGRVRGMLLPGNLAVATGLLGTMGLPPLTGVILAFEDLGEAPYRLDRMLTQWRTTGVLERVGGIALGRFSSCKVNPAIPSLSASEVLRDRLSDLGIPVVSELPFGHEGVNAALPVGVEVELDGDRGLLSF